MTMSNFILGADVGGTHISSAVVNTAEWSILSPCEARNSVFSAGDAKSIFLQWKQAIESSLSSCSTPIHQLGIAMPGPFDYEQGISYMQGQNKYDQLFEVNIREALIEELQIKDLDIRFINDAAAFLQGEVFTQQLTHHPKILGITLGTGLGSSVWTKGEKAIDAALWDAPYQAGIFEEYLTTRWFVNRFYEETAIAVNGLKEIIVDHADHPFLSSLFDEFVIHFIQFLNYFSDLYQSNRFIIGGNISHILPQLLQRHKKAFSPFELYKSQLEEKAAIIGATTIF